MCSAQDELHPSPASLYSEPELYPSPASLYSKPEPHPTSSPLAQLLASATGSRSLVFPAISGQRNKRKPFQLQHKGQSRFRPKSLRTKNQVTIGNLKSVQEIQAPTTLKPRFPGFLARTGLVKQTNIHNNTSGKDQTSTPLDQTTRKPLKLTDFFETPEPAVAPTREATVDQNPILFAITNDISANAISDQRALFERLQSITGAQLVGVSMDLAGMGEQEVSERKVGNRVPQIVGLETTGDPAAGGESNHGKSVGEETRGDQTRVGKPSGNQVLGLETGWNQMLVEKPRGAEVLNGEIREYQGRQQKHRRRGKAGGRRRTVDRKLIREEVENEEIQGKQLSFDTAPRSPRRKKSNFIRKKRNKARVATVDRYRYENEDGSITWGYKNDDGGFKVTFLLSPLPLAFLWVCSVQEETIGVDCITHGKYGYTDSYGEKMEYSYSSGVRCDPENRKVRGEENWGSIDIYKFGTI